MNKKKNKKIACTRYNFWKGFIFPKTHLQLLFVPPAITVVVWWGVLTPATWSPGIPLWNDTLLPSCQCRRLGGRLNEDRIPSCSIAENAGIFFVFPMIQLNTLKDDSTQICHHLPLVGLREVLQEWGVKCGGECWGKEDATANRPC